MFPYRYAWEILCSVHVEEVLIFQNGYSISALKHIRMFLLSRYVLLTCKKTIYKYGHAWVT